jgi:uncharacterized protein YdeI (YjbR/CyaY-like superfamily)
MKKPNPQVDGFIRKSKQWQEELQQLRTILLNTSLVEEVKWRQPCYTFQGSNIVVMGRFKESCLLNFVKGALLKNGKGILVKPGENSQSSRVIRFTSVQQIAKLKPIVKACIDEAIAAEKAGLKVKFKKVAEFKIPVELQNKFDELPALKTAFAALTPGRQRGYLLHFSGAKQSKTRESRVEKYVQRILKGQGLDDE